MFVNGRTASCAVSPDEKSMVRRTRDEALATREALLDAAERVFRASGVTRATLGDVASAAGVTRGAVYWHFRDKGELFGAMCSRATLPMQSRLEQAADGDGDDAIATLREVSVRALREIASDPRTRAVLEILLCKSERRTQRGRRRAARGRNGSPVRSAPSSASSCARSPRAGCQPDTDSNLAAHLLQAFFHGVIQLWLTHPERLRPQCRSTGHG
jgi:TetR/AcrR family acrAB operon transcriptional repressor